MNFFISKTHTETQHVLYIDLSNMRFAIGMLRELMEVGVPLMRTWSSYQLILAIFVLGFLVYFYAPYWGVRKIPGPPTHFLVGHLPLLSKYGPDVLRVFAKEYGPIFRYIVWCLLAIQIYKVHTEPLLGSSNILYRHRRHSSFLILSGSAIWIFLSMAGGLPRDHQLLWDLIGLLSLP